VLGPLQTDLSAWRTRAPRMMGKHSRAGGEGKDGLVATVLVAIQRDGRGEGAAQFTDPEAGGLVARVEAGENFADV
jgi:hypothetical protein